MYFFVDHNRNTERTLRFSFRRNIVDPISNRSCEMKRCMSNTKLAHVKDFRSLASDRKFNWSPPYIHRLKAGKDATVEVCCDGFGESHSTRATLHIFREENAEKEVFFLIAQHGKEFLQIRLKSILWLTIYQMPFQVARRCRCTLFSAESKGTNTYP
jgi:hypothetical protein